MSKKEEQQSKAPKVLKIVPSKLEIGVQKLLYRTLGKYIPASMTPNRITLLGALGGGVGIICGALSKISPFFLLGTIGGLICHFICDDLDGYVARERNLSSTTGGYFDLLTDILHITYLIIALAFAGYISFPVAVFLVPVYALIIFTAMNYILYLREFLFPRLGPIETHLFFIAVCIAGIFCGQKPLFTMWSVQVSLPNLMCVVGGVAMYYEMIRLQVQLLRRLHKKDKMGKERHGE